jgi:TPR repeat protein
MFQAYLDQVSGGRFPGTYKSLAEIKIATLRKDAAADSKPAAPNAQPPTRPVIVKEAAPPPAPAAAPSAAPATKSEDAARSPEIDSCDRAAAAPADQEKPADAPGVTFGSIDASAAIRACRKAIDVAGAPRRVFFQLARAISKSGNVVDALTYYKKAVELGHVGAMHDLAGLLRAGGRGIKRDQGLAMALYEKAAAAGLNESVVQLAAMYADGRSGRPDYAKALELYQRAADAHTPGAYTNLGVLYYEGHGVRRDAKKACDYWREGSSLGDEMAAKNLKRSCRVGIAR